MWNATECLFVINLILLLAVNINCYPKTGPAVKATNGEVWPKPQQRRIDSNFFVLSPAFQFVIRDETCSILVEAIKRYKKIVEFTPGYEPSTRKTHLAHLFNSVYKSIETIDVVLRNKCSDDEIPDMDMDESYTVNIDSNGNGKIEADSIWGMLRGLETFSQMIYSSTDRKSLLINVSTITDFPRFSHRGLLIDTSRHFLPMNTILRTIDAMEYNKMNVLHWHMTDDQSFPYESIYFPDLSAKGAFHPTLVYSQKDVFSVIEYARERGIRVMVEFDTPGHTRSWGEAVPKLLTACYSSNQPDGNLGPIDPIRNTTYAFLKKFFKEIVNVFPEQYIHLGGDEVDFTCWKSNPFISIFMKENGIESYEKLEEYYVQKLVDLVDELKASSVVWEEVFSNGVVLPKDTVVHVWIDGADRKNLMGRITQAGYRLLLSAGWYLDFIEGGGDWEKYYNNDATDFPGTEQQKQLVIGGEACMWGEVVDAANVLSRVWPRASAVAERLWSDAKVTDIDDAKRRLEEHYCRMQKRGIPAQPPNGPGFCI